MSAEKEILREVKEGLFFPGISVVPREEAKIYKVSNALGFDVFILFCVEPFGTVCFSNDKERYYYRVDDVKPILLEGDPPQELNIKLKDWLVKRWDDFLSAFGDAACREIPSKIAP